MLPDFLIPIEIRPGARRSLQARDVPACVFWQGYPELDDYVAPNQFFRQREAEFFEHLLERVVVKPRLTLAQVRGLGVSSESAVREYLATVGYYPRAFDRPAGAEELLTLASDLEPLPQRAEQAAFRSWRPAPGISLLFKVLAETVHQPASVFWAMPISEMLFNYNVHLSDQQKAEAPLPAPPSAVRDRLRLVR